jgi:hypothetical protein
VRREGNRNEYPGISRRISADTLIVGRVRMDARFASAPRGDSLCMGNRPGNCRMLALLGIGVVGSGKAILRIPSLFAVTANVRSSENRKPAEQARP